MAKSKFFAFLGLCLLLTSCAFFANKDVYRDKEANCRFIIPQGWQVVSRNTNEEHFLRFMRLKPAFLSEEHLVCYLFENLSNLEKDPFPHILVGKRVAPLNTPEEAKKARETYRELMRKQKEKIAQGQIEKEKLHIIKNKSGEEIFCITQSVKKNELRNAVMFIYNYSHVGKDNKHLYSFLIIGSCWIEDAEKYLNLFDNFVSNFSAIN